MITIATNLILFFLILFGNGIIFLKKIFGNSNNNNFYEILLIGLVVTIFLSQFINFFLPLSNYLTLLNILIVLLYFSFNKIVIKSLKINFKIFFILFVLVLSNIYASEFSEDLNHYHYGMISNSDKTNLIWEIVFFMTCMGHHLYG